MTRVVVIGGGCAGIAAGVGAHAGHYLCRLKGIGFLPDNPDKAKKRIKDAGLTGLFAQRVT